MSFKRLKDKFSSKMKMIFKRPDESVFKCYSDSDSWIRMILMNKLKQKKPKN